MPLPTCALLAVLSGLATGLLARKFSPPPSPPHSPHQTEKKPANPSPGQNQPIPEFTDQISDLTPDQRKKAERYLFLQQATSAELTYHWLTLLEDPNISESQLWQFASSWVRRNPKNALSHLSESDKPELYYRCLAQHNPENALSLIDPKNGHQIARVISAIGLYDPDHAIALFYKSTEYYRRFAIGGIIAGLFDRSPVEALDFAYQNRAEKYNFHIGVFLQKWATQNPHAAFHWTLTHPEIHPDHLDKLAPYLLHCDPQLFTTEFAKLPNGEVKNQLLAARGAHLAQSDSKASLNFAKQQSPDLRQIILNEIGRTTYHEDPGLALDILAMAINQETELTSASPSRNAPPSIWTSDWIQAVVKNNPESVMELATKADSRNTSLPKNSICAVEMWLNHDSGAARNWLQNQPPGDMRDQLTSRATKHLVNTSPSDFLEILALPDQIQSPELRQQTLNSMFDTLAFELRENLEERLKDHQLTPEQQKAYDQRSYN